ncbi:MAG TPA: branched-chain amino acid ABC transporter ATP-binding protein/permease [Mycobacteriales bacterium]|nr:branched-chain amino acid ABC transporter ATP-binding protein/permease [Mycobacteriales bacterium]
MSAWLRLPSWLRIVVILVLLAAVPPLLGRNAGGLLNEAHSYSVGRGVCFAAAAISLNLLMGYAGQISLGHFALVGVGAFSTGLLTAPNRLDLPFMVAVPLAALAGALVAFVIGLPALRLRGLYLAIVTIGFSYAMVESVFRIRSLTGGSAGITVPRPWVRHWSFANTYDYLAVALLVLAGLWLLDRNVTRTRLGRAFQAIRADESVAQAYGVDVARYKLLAFVLSGAFAGVAGAMYGSLYGFVNAGAFELQFSLLLVIVVVVGGLGSRPGVVASALLFATLPELLKAIRGWELIVGGALLMFAVARHPGGFPEAIAEARERRLLKARAGEPEPALPTLPDMPRPTGLADRPREAAGQPLLRVRDVSVSFGGLRAVDGASLEVQRGRIVGLIGPNGAGKTTLFNAVSGLVRTDSGTVELLGRDVTRLAPHARAAAGMGRTFQLIGLAKDLSVTENLLLAQHSVAGYTVPEALAWTGRTPRAERELRGRAAEAVAALGFERYAHTPVKFLSHGQQRIVELGCVLVTAPELVMLDEPSAGMSPGAAENLAVRLADIRDQLGRTVLVIEHNIPLVLDLCDDLFVLDAGRVIASGPAREVAALPEVVGAYLGEAVPV